MKQLREFTEEELMRMGTQRVDPAEVTLKGSNKEAAIKEIRAFYREFLSMHNILRYEIG
jgi:hypothetical protein